MRTFKKDGSGRVWKLLQTPKDLEINDIISINYGPGKTRRGLYKISDINDLTITLITSYSEKIIMEIREFYKRYTGFGIHILNPDIKEEWLVKQNKQKSEVKFNF
jgi:hypothetical protein